MITIKDYLAHFFNKKQKLIQEIQKQHAEQVDLIKSLLEENEQLESKSDTLSKELELASIQQQNNESLLDKQKEHIKRLQREILKQLFYKELAFSADERITIFVNQFTTEFTGFQAVSRYSGNTDFCNISKVNAHSIYQPLLSSVFQGSKEDVFIDDLPSFNSASKYLRKLHRYCSGNKYTPEQLNQMRMKPRSFHLIIFSDDEERKGIVMLESAREKAFDPNKNLLAVRHVQHLLLKVSFTPNIYH